MIKSNDDNSESGYGNIYSNITSKSFQHWGSRIHFLFKESFQGELNSTGMVSFEARRSIGNKMEKSVPDLRAVLRIP